MKIAIRNCCFECLAVEEVKRNSKKLTYSIIKKGFVNENGVVVKADGLMSYLDGK